MYSDNLTQKVADAAAKIMDEQLKGNQHKIDANKNGKIDAEDFKLLKAKKEVKKEEVEQIDELKKSTLGSYVNAAARDAVHRTAQEVETGRLDKLADKRMKGIKLATKKLAKEETEQVEEGYYKDIDTNRKEDERLAAQKKKEVPFTPDKPAKKVATAGKFGYGYSAARHLARKGLASVTKEDVEQVDEAITKTATGYIHHARPGVYGGSEKEKHVVDTLRGPKKSEIEAIEKEKKMKKFSEMLDLINSQGLKALSEMIKEEPDNETFTKELKDQEAKAAGKKKQADIAKGAVQAVKVEEDVEQLDELSKKTLGSYVKKAHRSGTDNSFDHGADEHRQDGDPDDTEREKEMEDRERAIANREKGIHRAVKRLTKEEQVEERSLTEPEMKKKEEIVKSMKKGLAGFKARYGDRAKEVMYATATKRAMGENVEQIDEAFKKPDSHGVVILKKTHEVPSHVVHGEQGKNYTLHLHDVYHQKPGKKEKKIGQIESNIHNDDDEDEAHVVSRHKDGEDFHMETHHAIDHLKNIHKIPLNTPVKRTKAPNFKKGNTDNLPNYL